MAWGRWCLVVMVALAMHEAAAEATVRTMYLNSSIDTVHYIQGTQVRQRQTGTERSAQREE